MHNLMVEEEPHLQPEAVTLSVAEAPPEYCTAAQYRTMTVKATSPSKDSGCSTEAPPAYSEIVELNVEEQQTPSVT